MGFHWIVVQPVVPDYRDGFFPLVEKSLPGLVIISGDEDFFPGIRKTRKAYRGLITVKNVFLVNRSLLWQRGVVSRCLRKDVVVLNFNTRVLSSWVVATCRKVMGRPTLLWGHISGRNRRLHHVRHLMMRLCDGFITYTEEERRRLARMHPEIRSFTAPNACLPRARIRYEASKRRKHVLYVGRLEEAKKPLLAVRAFLEATDHPGFNTETLLYLVGEGSLCPVIETILQEHRCGDRVRLMGHIADEECLERLYSEACLSLSPGYIGLSAMQSFAFGIPMLVSRNEPHSPEVAMCEEGFNTRFLASGKVREWAGTIGEILRGEITFASGEEISGRIREQYSFEEMSERFVEAVRAVSRKEA